MNLKVDRPFLFFIEDETTHTVVFVGKVVNPVQKNNDGDMKNNQHIQPAASTNTTTSCVRKAPGN